MKLNYNKAEFVASYGTYSQLPQGDRVEIAFAGHSNVGKSTLINKLFNRKNLARVSSVPGKTATINFYGLENIYFVDGLKLLGIDWGECMMDGCHFNDLGFYRFAENLNKYLYF